MVSKFDHLKLPRINIELPRRSAARGGFGGTKRDVSEHGRRLLNQFSPLIEPVKEKTSPFRLDPKLIFKIKIAEKGYFSEDMVTQAGLNLLACEPNKAIVVFSSDNQLTEFKRRLENYSQIQEGHKYEYLGAIDELVPLEREDRIGRLLG
jgi:hypothetical protein